MFLQTTLLSFHNTDFKTKPLLKYLCSDCIFSSVLTSACIGVRCPAHTWLYGKPLWDTCKEPHALRRLFLTSKPCSFTAAQCAKVAVWCLGYPAAPLQRAPGKQLMHSPSAVPQGSQQVCAVLGAASSLEAAKDAIRGWPQAHSAVPVLPKHPIVKGAPQLFHPTALYWAGLEDVRFGLCSWREPQEEPKSLSNR